MLTLTVNLVGLDSKKGLNTMKMFFFTLHIKFFYLNFNINIFIYFSFVVLFIS